MVTATYREIHGVEVDEYQDDDDTEGPTLESMAKVEEMYIDEGRLYISLVNDDRALYIYIPIQPTQGWDEFVDSLPRFDDAWSGFDVSEPVSEMARENDPNQVACILDGVMADMNMRVVSGYNDNHGYRIV